MSAELVQRALTAPTFVAVRRRVFRQLLESLLYEGAVRVRSDGDGAAVVDGVDDGGDPVRYIVDVRRRHTFDRIAVGPAPVRRQAGDGEREACSVSGFLGEVRGALEAAPQQLARFAHELEETLVKDALAQYVREQRGDVLATAGYDTLEATITDGHRYHPTYKSRVGFDVADNLAFGPEFAESVRPLWLAARRSITELSLSGAVREEPILHEQLGTAVLARFAATIQAAGEEPADFALVPVHPWQWRERIARAFSDHLAAGDLLVLGEDPHAFAAQQSVRTLACADVPQRPYLKLALSIVNTSTSRVLAPHTVHNAPLVSDWLRGLAAADPFLRDELRTVLLGEVMGAAVTPPAAAGADGYGALACIWRESLHPRLDAGEQAVPFNGLTARERDGTPLVDAWVRALGLQTWLARVVEVSAIPLLHLLCRHGVALEAHAQNMVLLHRDGVPTRVALRDFHDGVRFSRAALAEPERCPDLLPPPAHHQNRNSFLETDDLGLVADFLLDAFFFINLGELAIFLADAYDLDERSFWATAGETITAYERRFPELAERFALFDVRKPAIAVEKLATRRLLPDTELRLHAVRNPLACR
ncbi:MAG TPA: IucA/IucC family protein [Solirubrobacteraceae bacterium]|nr:IucA/IucC family protein [Solirubrobacteraceae bacterium]